jgi:outer membrane protein insertion porin family
LFINNSHLLKIKLTYYFSLLLILILSSCGQYKSLRKNQFLLRKNQLEIVGDDFNSSEIQEYIRQKPNNRILGLPYGIWIYSSIDSLSIAKKRNKHISKLRAKNLELYDKQARINRNRNEKAIKKGKIDYKFKSVIPYDTINIRLSLKEWLKVRLGEKPVVFDSSDFNKTLEQFSIYFRKKGYYDALILGNVEYYKRKQKVKVNYKINTGKVYIIDTVFLKSENQILSKLYNDFSEKQNGKIISGAIFNTEKLNDYREQLSKYMRDNGIYGMNSSNIQFIADSNQRNKTVNLSLEFTPRLYKNRFNEKIENVSYSLTKVKDVFFHIIDTSNVPYNFKRKVENLEKSLITNGYVTTIDTVIFTNNIGLNAEKFRNKLQSITDSLKKTRTIVLTFNNSYWIRPYVLEDVNLIQSNTYYSEENYDKTILKLSDLGIFQTVKPEIVDFGDEVEVHFYLVPKKKLIYNLKPLIKTSGVFVGISGVANFTNLNLFKGAEKMVLGFTGGFQSMPNLNYSKTSAVNENVSQVFNTFEVGPSVKFELPGLFPISRSYLRKTQESKTLLQSSYGFQRRNVFTLQTFRLNYIYNFSIGKNTEIQFGFPGFSSINFVNYLEFDENFRKSIYSKNDPFTQNYYKSQLNWEDFKLIYQYQNNQQNFKLNTLFFKSSIDLVGNFISLFSKPSQDVTSKQRTLLGIPYSQFFKFDNEFVLANKISKETSLHTRLQIGTGIPYQNSQFSVPFDYSFFGGGPNDMRAWRAGTLGPGSYNSYKDTNYSSMQLGDVRFGFSSEIRFKVTKTFKGALFIDAGNIWTTNSDVKRPGAQFTNQWYKEIALASGFGVRADFDFLVVRFDCGFKLRNPAMAEGHRWFFDSKDESVYQIIDKNKNNYISPFLPRTFNDLFNSFRVGIGYPF